MILRAEVPYRMLPFVAVRPCAAFGATAATSVLPALIFRAHSAQIAAFVLEREPDLNSIISPLAAINMVMRVAGSTPVGACSVAQLGRAAKKATRRNCINVDISVRTAFGLGTVAGALLTDSKNRTEAANRRKYFEHNLLKFLLSFAKNSLIYIVNCKL